MYTLITAANSAEAYKLKNTLNPADLILGDYEDLPSFMLASANFIRLPDPASISYAHQMLTLCLDKQISTVYALRKDEESILLQSEQLFNEYGIEVVHG